MRETRKINDKHPDYPKYIEECKKLRDIFVKQEDEAYAKHPKWRGLDHPATEQIVKITRSHNEALKALQKKYYYLFVES